MVHKHDTSLFEIKKWWEMLGKIVVEVLMSLSLHENLHRGQNLCDTMSVVVCTFLLLDLFELKNKAVNYQSQLFDAIKRAEYFLVHIGKNLRWRFAQK